VSRLNTTPVMPLAVRAMANERVLEWSFNHYLAIAPPEFALATPTIGRRASVVAAAA
jgi:hypothetical protein